MKRDYLKRERMKCGLRQADVAIKLGITTNAYKFIEQGRTKNISITRLKILSKLLNLKIREIKDFESDYQYECWINKKEST